MFSIKNKKIYKVYVYSLLSLYRISNDHHYVRPQIVKKRVILIRGGRHPLIEQDSTFMQNDILSGENDNVIKIITGPNSCGKSTIIKQIALTVFMAHIGMYVSANRAVIGVVSHIFAKIITCESISIESSSFLQDIRQVNI